MPKDQGRFGPQVDSLAKALLLHLYCNFVHLVLDMDTVSVNQFRDKLKTLVEQVVTSHTPLKVTRRAEEAFVVMSAYDWEREQETLYILQNNNLIKQIADSMATHNKSTGYSPTSKQINKTTGI